MTTISPVSIGISQKKKLWKEHKYNQFKQISADKSTLFNYFIMNNDLFKIIQPADQVKVKMASISYASKSANIFLGTFGLVFLTDQILMRFLMPNFRIPRFRFLVFIGKYLLLPCIGFSIGKSYLMGTQQQTLFKLNMKYDLGFQQYMNANRIFDRALQVDRLEQLLQKRSNFDWTGIPQLKQQK